MRPVDIWTRYRLDLSSGIAGVMDFDETPHTVRYMQRKRRKANTRLPYNVRPVGVREHVMVCNYCDLMSKMTVDKRGQWKYRKGLAKHSYSYQVEGIREHATIRIPIALLEGRGYTAQKELIRHHKLLRIARFIYENWLPFELDGLNVKTHDLAHCSLCDRTMVITDYDNEVGLKSYRWINLRREMSDFREKLADHLRDGTFEKIFQDRVLGNTGGQNGHVATSAARASYAV